MVPDITSTFGYQGHWHQTSDVVNKPVGLGGWRFDPEGRAIITGVPVTDDFYKLDVDGIFAVETYQCNCEMVSPTSVQGTRPAMLSDWGNRDVGTIDNTKVASQRIFTVANYTEAVTYAVVHQNVVAAFSHTYTSTKVDDAAFSDTTAPDRDLKKSPYKSFLVPYPVSSIDLTPDGKYLVIGCSSFYSGKGCIYVVDTYTGALRGMEEGVDTGDNLGEQVAISWNGNCVVSHSATNLAVLEYKQVANPYNNNALEWQYRYVKDVDLTSQTEIDAYIGNSNGVTAAQLFDSHVKFGGSNQLMYRGIPNGSGGFGVAFVRYNGIPDGYGPFDPNYATCFWKSRVRTVEQERERACLIQNPKSLVPSGRVPRRTCLVPDGSSELLVQKAGGSNVAAWDVTGIVMVEE